MNYRNIYYSIINKAKEEDKNGNRHVGYFEKHHILPKSLGGSNNEENLIKLSAREHFICHWLLVKMYDKGSAERNKMLCAFWKMQQNPKGNKRYINSRAYAKLREEYSLIMHINQTGNKNSQYGMIWYTNRNTGESKKFKEMPVEEFWIKGRNLFHGEYSAIKLTIVNLYKKETHVNINKYFNSINETKKLWDEFHAGNYKTINDFAKTLNRNKNAIFIRFKRYIPIFNTNKKRSCRRYSSNKDLIGKYE